MSTTKPMHYTDGELIVMTQDLCGYRTWSLADDLLAERKSRAEIEAALKLSDAAFNHQVEKATKLQADLDTLQYLHDEHTLGAEEANRELRELRQQVATLLAERDDFALKLENVRDMRDRMSNDVMSLSGELEIQRAKVDEQSKLLALHEPIPCTNDCPDRSEHLDINGLPFCPGCFEQLCQQMIEDLAPDPDDDDLADGGQAGYQYR